MFVDCVDFSLYIYIYRRPLAPRRRYIYIYIYTAFQEHFNFVIDINNITILSCGNKTNIGIATSLCNWSTLETCLMTTLVDYLLNVLTISVYSLASQSGC